MTRKQRRGVLIGVGVAVLTLAVGLVLFALRDSIVFFHTPSDLAEKPIASGQRFRLGGLVAEGSVKRGEGTKVEFAVTDTLKTVPVSYEGVLPDLFQEGQGVVAEGKLDAGRHVRRRQRARQARRELHAAGGRQGARGEGREARQGRAASRGSDEPMHAIDDRGNAERWRRVIVELGHFALILALLVAVFQMVVPAWGARDTRRAPDGRGRSGRALPVRPHRLSLPGADARLRHVRLLRRQRRLQLAFDQAAALSHLRRVGEPRRLDGAVGADPGAVRRRGRRLRPQPAARRSRPTCSPCRRRSRWPSCSSSCSPPIRSCASNPPPADGSGLNPILQDPALAFHPPFLYTGYVGFSIAFSFAIAALIEGRIDAAWARWVRPWTLAAWMCLTIGIAMGSWWAYYELGWGGWWFWDPVENASFMPWLAGTALLHSALVMEKRDALKVWTMLLAILTFSLSLMGTFLVRSGVLTSVHAFAVDPQRGVFILAIMTLFTGGGLALFAWRARDLRQGGIFAPISREGALVLNNILLTTACATVLVGTLYPLLLESLTGDKISVGPPYFDWTFGPLMVPLLLALPFGPFLAWKRGDVLGAAQRLMFAAMLAVVVMVLALAVLSARAVAGAVRHRARRVRHGRRRVRSRLAHTLRQRAAGAKPGGASPTCRARPSARRWRTSASACWWSASSRPAPTARSASSS